MNSYNKRKQEAEAAREEAKEAREKLHILALCVKAYMLTHEHADKYSDQTRTETRRAVLKHLKGLVGLERFD